MKTWKSPLPGYSWLVHQVWYLELDKDDAIPHFPWLIPNPRAHLLITPSDQDYHYGNDLVSHSGKGCHLLSASDQMLKLTDSPPIKRIGITFQPQGIYLLNHGAARPLSQCGWDNWLDKMFPLDFRQSLLDNTDRKQIIETIAQHLQSLDIEAFQDKPYSQTSQVIQQITHMIENDPSCIIDIDHLAHSCNSSRRTLERHFRQITGFSLKQYLTLAKLELMILSLYQQKSQVDWTEFAHRFGFSDQSHLIKQLRKQLQRTPSQYLSHRDLTIDVYGDFED